jgi:hypothetical protein
MRIRCAMTVNNLRIDDIQVPYSGFTVEEFVKYMEENYMKSIKKAQIPEMTKSKEDGTTGKGTVIDIQEGVVEEFLNEAGKTKWKGDQSAPAYNLIIQIPEGGTFSSLMTISSSDRSSLQKFRKLYKGLEVGIEVDIVVENGFWRVRL